MYYNCMRVITESYRCQSIRHFVENDVIHRNYHHQIHPCHLQPSEKNVNLYKSGSKPLNQ